jgi:hypothetical protein
MLVSEIQEFLKSVIRLQGCQGIFAQQLVHHFGNCRIVRLSHMLAGGLGHVEFGFELVLVKW